MYDISNSKILEVELAGEKIKFLLQTFSGIGEILVKIGQILTSER